MRFSCFDELLRHWAETAPDAPALLFERGGKPEALSFAGLYDEVRREAERLRGEGFGRLGLLCDGSRETVIELFAAVLAGKSVTMLDGLAAEALLQEQIGASDTDALFGDPELKELLRPAARVETAPGEILFFTSGTTSSARAVVLTEQSLCSSAWNGGALLPLAPEDRLLCLLPLNHVFGFVCGLLWALSCGASVALGRGPRHYADDGAFYAPTAVSVVPALLGFLLKAKALNPELKLILVGAGGCPPALLAAAAACGKKVAFGYGLTETSSGVALSLGEGDPALMTVCPEMEVRIAEDGEVLLRAPTVMMKGYYRQSEETAAVLRGGVLYTGDLGSLDENGRLRITGRKKDILVLPDGTKIFLPEYEAALAAALGGRELAVIEENGAPVLVLPGREDERDAVTAALRPVMAAYPRGQQVREIRFRAAPLPRTATGKIQRWSLVKGDK